MINIYKPYITKKSLNYAHEALNSSWLSSQGKFLQIAKEKIQDLLNVKHVLLLNNGTSACHLVAKSLSRVYNCTNNKKIIVPNNVYVAAWNAFLFDNEYELIPIDADLNTWNFDLKKLDETINKYPDANVLIVHNIGNIINVPELQCKYPNINFVEDNCEGFLGKYNDAYSGTKSMCSAISFFGNKNITCGEGGAFITNIEDEYLYANCIHGQGQSSKKFIHNELGHNYRMTNIQAAILCGQLEILPDILNMKSEIFEIYRKNFKNREDILIQSIPENTCNANWMFGVRVPKQTNFEQAELFFTSQGIEIRPMFYSILTHAHLKYNSNILNNDCSNANSLNKECFILPSYPELTKKEQRHIIKSVNIYLESVK